MKLCFKPNYDSDNTHMHCPDVVVTPYEEIVTIELESPQRLIKIAKADWLALVRATKSIGE